MITVKTYSLQDFCEKEILRYSKCCEDDENALNMIKLCEKEALCALTYNVCYCVLPVKIDGDKCDFSAFQVTSRNLSANLNGCSRVLLFAATIGTAMDRLIARCGAVSPAKELFMHAIGAERAEALCDVFCSEYESENNVRLKPRFSPGYGDLSLEVQRDIFKLLQCPAKIGLTLNDTLIMSPSKSVTAFAGICKE